VCKQTSHAESVSCFVLLTAWGLPDDVGLQINVRVAHRRHHLHSWLTQEPLSLCQPALTPNALAPVFFSVQGFPDRFFFHGHVQNKHRQVGNAVPPPLARALGGQLRKALEASHAEAIAMLMAQQ